MHISHGPTCEIWFQNHTGCFLWFCFVGHLQPLSVATLPLLSSRKKVHIGKRRAFGSGYCKRKTREQTGPKQPKTPLFLIDYQPWGVQGLPEKGMFCGAVSAKKADKQKPPEQHGLQRDTSPLFALLSHQLLKYRTVDIFASYQNDIRTFCSAVKKV